MPYHLDFLKMDLSDLQAKLERTDLIPSHLPLLDGIERKLSALEKAGISDLEALSSALRGGRGPASLATKSGLSEDYLVLLRRVIEGFRPKPIPLGDYPGIEPGTAAALGGEGIRDSKALYEAAPDEKATKALAKKAGIAVRTVQELLDLADLSRIQWVSPTFARVLHDAGYRKASDIAAANAEEVYKAVIRANEGGRLYKGKIGLRDIRRLVVLAGEL
jgi:predicted flap endonuclease-1-like 5' DNA nuclease